jgi:fumarate reductase iron-sulfur subunit
MSDTIILEVARFHPERDAEPSYESFEVPLRGDWMVLDGLNYIKDQLDGSLAFRWSCRMGICGSCGMMVNDVPKLTCETLLTEFAPGPVRIGPQVRPWIVRKDDFQPQREFLQSPAQLDAFKQFSLCINCMLCYAACPVYGLDPSFTGPAALALAERYNLDSRDQGSAERTDVLSQHDGIWDCTVIGECSVVCPKHVDPSLAIQQYKITATTDWFKTWLMPWGNK